VLFPFPLNAENEKTPENLQMELNNLQCHCILHGKLYETKLQEVFALLECFAALDGS